jgi:hypothetical protein
MFLLITLFTRKTPGSYANTQRVIGFSLLVAMYLGHLAKELLLGYLKKNRRENFSQAMLMIGGKACVGVAAGTRPVCDWCWCPCTILLSDKIRQDRKQEPLGGFC